ncbi:hypothetical protein GJ496_004725 [Pomphorhynchus laevis]|nr:hypothetical protein GJ496_004725 [Pomphorhynchus laevis]
MNVDSEKKERVQLRVYNSFTEVREKLSINEESKHCKVTLPEELFQQVIAHSIEVECDECRFQTVTKKSINLEGRTVYVRRKGAGISNSEEIRKAVLLRGKDWLVKDLETQHFYNVARHELEFDDMPTENVYDVEFFFDESCKQTDTTLRYQLRTVKWKPKYELSIIDDSDSKDISKTSIQAKLKCIAILDNNSPTNYIVEKAELFGGQVQKHDGPILKHSALCMKDTVGCAGGAVPESHFESTEISGIYMYELLNQFLMNAYSSSYIEFMRPKIEVEELSVIQLTNPTNDSRLMNRIYTLVTDEFLPAGYISIRNRDRIIGGHDLQGLPASEKREISPGQDSAAVYKREEKLISQSKKQTVLSVSLDLINNHSKSRRFRYREVFVLHRINVIYEIRDYTHMKLIERGLEINIDAPANGSLHFDYNLTKVQIDLKT